MIPHVSQELVPKDRRAVGDPEYFDRPFNWWIAAPVLLVRFALFELAIAYLPDLHTAHRA